MDLEVGFVLDREVFLATLAKGTLSIAREPVDGAEAVFAARSEAVAAAIHGKLPLGVLEDAGDLVVSGSRAAAELFVTLFNLPPKAAARPARGG